MSKRGELEGIITQEQRETIGRMYEAFASAYEIAAETGLTFHQVRSRLNYELRHGLRVKRYRAPMTHAQRVAKQREARRREQSGWEAIGSLGLDLGNGPRLTPEQIADRNRRLSLAPRDLTAALLGDPLPGFSASERRT